MANPLLEVSDLEVAYGDVGALWGVSMHVDPGTIVAIVGANGAGKTTLLRTVSGLLTPKGGDIRLAGQSLTGKAPEAIARHGHRACAGRARPVSPDDGAGKPRARRLPAQGAAALKGARWRKPTRCFRA